MKIAKKHMNRMAQYSRNSNTHNKKGVHGKWLENFLSDHYDFPQYDQYKAKVDFPKEIVEQGNVPAEWVADWEVKYYNIKTPVVMLGDLERKMECLKNGLVIVIGFYDGTPDNLVDIKFIKAKANNNLIKYFDAWKKVSQFVKNRENSIEETKQFVKQANAENKSKFLIANNSQPISWKTATGKSFGEARAVSLAITTKNLMEL